MIDTTRTVRLPVVYAPLVAATLSRGARTDCKRRVLSAMGGAHLDIDVLVFAIDFADADEIARHLAGIATVSMCAGYFAVDDGVSGCESGRCGVM